MEQDPKPTYHRFAAKVLTGLILTAVIAVGLLMSISRGLVANPATARRSKAYQPRRPVDTGGFFNVLAHLPRWKPDASLEEISNIYRGLGYKNIAKIDRTLSDIS